MVEKKRREQKDRNRPDQGYNAKNSDAVVYESDTFELTPKKSLQDYILGNASPERENFDWDSFESGSVSYNKETKKDLADMYANTFNDVEEKVVVMGTVVGMTDKDAVLNIGFKSDGLVPLSEFKYRPDLKIGDEVEVIIETKEDKNGQIVISHKKAQAEKAWGDVEKAFEEGTVVTGYIKDRTKGGMVVDLMGLDAFLPGSQLDVKPIKDYEDFVGKHMDLKIVKINPIYRNIVVSHKAIIESDLEAQKSTILGKLEKGQILVGVIKNLTTFGVFVDLGGVDGLIHITDVSWSRVNHPEEILEVGQQINVVVLDYDENKKRISLGMKQLTPHPWETLTEEIVVGSKVKGKIVNLEDYGAFVEILPGVEGLIHVSEMSWSTHLKSPNEYVKLGEEIEAVVISLDREDRKLSLGIKQLTEDPWTKIGDKYAVGTRHTSTVRSMTNYGLFVELEEGIDGLVHISDLSWTKKFNHPAEFTKVGEKLDVMVLELDQENRKVSLGHRQLEEDPWDSFESIFFEGAVHEGTILSLEEKGAVISLAYGVEAFAPKKFMAKQDKSKAKVDELLQFKVIEFDKSNKKIIISHSDIWKDEERKKAELEESAEKEKDIKTKKDVKKVNKANPDKSTLADELDILAQLKIKMEAEDREKQKEAMAKMDAKLKSKEETTEETPEEKAAEESAE